MTVRTYKHKMGFFLKNVSQIIVEQLQMFLGRHMMETNRLILV